jgi:hypothetical protein
MNWWICNTHLVGRNNKGQLTKIGYKQERQEWATSNKELLKLDQIDPVIVTAPRTRMALCASGDVYRWNSRRFRKLHSDEMADVTEYLLKQCEEPPIRCVSRRKIRFSLQYDYFDVEVVVKWNTSKQRAHFALRYIQPRMKPQRPSDAVKWSKTLNIVDYDKKRGYLLTADGKAYNVFYYNKETRKMAYQSIQLAKIPRKSAGFA